MMLSKAFAILFAVIGAHAAATGHPGGCNPELALPAGQDVIVAPAGQKLKYVALGLGTQNYTLDSTGAPTAIGAVARLVDASCLGKNGNYTHLTERKFKHELEHGVKYVQDHTKLPYLGQHYFQKFNGSASPTFDFRTGAQQGNPAGYVVTKKNASLPAPSDPAVNVPWLSLVVDPTKNKGDLATTVLRVYTAGGQPNSTYETSSPFEVPYAAIYAFYVPA